MSIVYFSFSYKKLQLISLVCFGFVFFFGFGDFLYAALGESLCLVTLSSVINCNETGGLLEWW